MRYFLLLIAVVVLVGCGKKEPPVIQPDPSSLLEQVRIQLNIQERDLEPADFQKITKLDCRGRGLTDLNGLLKCTGLLVLDLRDNPKLTEAQIGALQKALPKCQITHDGMKPLTPSD